MNSSEESLYSQISDVLKFQDSYDPSLIQLITFIHDLFSIEENNNNQSTQENIDNSSMNHAHSSIAQLNSTLKQIKGNDCICYFQLFDYFSYHRPKLIKCIPPLLDGLCLNDNLKEYIIYLYNQNPNSYLFRKMTYFVEDLSNKDDYSLFELFNNETMDETINYCSIIYSDNPNALNNFSDFISINKNNLKIQDDNPLRSFLPNQITEISIIDLCCFFGSIKCFKYFFMNEFGFTDKTQKYSVMGGNFEIIRIIVQKGLSFDNCFEKSVEYHHYSISDWLLTNFVCEDITLPDCLSYYNFEAFLFFYHNGHDINETSKNNLKAIHYAAINGFDELVSIFEDTNTKQIDDYGFTPMDYALKYLHVPFFKNLWGKEIQIANESFLFNVTLHIACINSLYDVAQSWIKAKYDVELRDSYERTPLHYACAQKHCNIVDLLFGCSINKEAKDCDGKTPIFFACENKRSEILEYLISKGCKVNVYDNNKKTPLHYASEKGYLPIVKILLSNKEIDKNAKNIYGETPIMAACIAGHFEIVKYLISKLCRITIFDNLRKTAFYHACENGFIDIVKFLFENKLSCYVSVDKISPISSACYHDHFEVVKYLSEKENHIHREDLLNIAKENNYTDIIEYFETLK